MATASPYLPRVHPSVSLALIGAFTGYLNGYIPEIAGQGALFGGMVGLYLHQAYRIGPARAVLVPAMFELSWQLAARFPMVTEVLENWSLDTVGAASGLIGATVVTACFAILFPAFRTWRAQVRPVAAGTVLGAALLTLVIDHETLHVLHIGWQSGVGAALGWNRRLFDVSL